MNEITGLAAPEHRRRRVPVAGHPGIYRRGDRYQVRWLHNGHERTKSFRLLSGAVRFKGSVVSGDTQATSREPFSRYASRWLDEYAGRTARGVEDGTRESYRDAIERLAIPFFKTTPLERIDPPMLRRFISHLAIKHSSHPRAFAATTLPYERCWQLRSTMACFARIPQSGCESWSGTAALGRRDGSRPSRPTICSRRCPSITPILLTSSLRRDAASARLWPHGGRT